MLDNPEHESSKLGFELNRALLAARYADTREERTEHIHLILKRRHELSMSIERLLDANEMAGAKPPSSLHFFKNLARIVAETLARLEDPLAAPARIPVVTVSKDPF